MFPNLDQYSSASKALLGSQPAAFSAMTAIAVQGMEKVVALHMAIAKASSEKFVAATNELMEQKDPQAFFSLTDAYTKPAAEKAAAYRRDLTDIVSSTKAELTKAASAQVAEAQSAWAASSPNNAPPCPENVIVNLDSFVAIAHAGHDTLQAVEATVTHVTPDQNAAPQ